MRESLKDHLLPESEAEYVELHITGRLLHLQCVFCDKVHDTSNTHTKLGWAETQISGSCEDCFDGLFKEKE